MDSRVLLDITARYLRALDAVSYADGEPVPPDLDPDLIAEEYDTALRAFVAR